MRTVFRRTLGVCMAAALAGSIVASPAQASVDSGEVADPHVAANSDGGTEAVYPLTSDGSEYRVTYPEGVQPQLSGGGKAAKYWIKLSPKDIQAAKAATGGAVAWVAAKLPKKVGGPVAAAAVVLSPYLVDIPCKSGQSLTIRWKVINGPPPYNYKVTGSSCR